MRRTLTRDEPRVSVFNGRVQNLAFDFGAAHARRSYLVLGSRGTKPGMRCVKKGKWKLIKYDVMDGAVRETQLFNLEENPDELIDEHHDRKVIALTGNTPKAYQLNLADDPKYAAERRELEALLLAEQIRLDDPFRLWDQLASGSESPSRPDAQIEPYACV